MKQTLYIHIGRPKVGSSAIQHFLHTNRASLECQGCIYPKNGIYQGANHRLALTFLPNLPDYRIVEKQNSADIYQQLIDEIIDSQLPKAVVSSENFWLINPGKIPSSLHRNFEVKIVCYVRRQDDVVASSIIQEIKGGQLAIDFDLESYICEPARRQLLDYFEVLKKWAKTFGEENILVRVVEHTKDKQGIERDLLSVLGIDNTQDFKIETLKKNASPARDVLELINEINQFPVGDLAKRGLAGPLTEISQIIGFDESLDSKNLLSPAQRQDILDTYRDSNSRLAQTYLGIEEKDLFPPINQSDWSAGYTEFEIKRFRQILAGIMVYQQRHIVQMRGTINDQQRRLKRLEELLEHGSEPLNQPVDSSCSLPAEPLPPNKKNMLARFINFFALNGKAGNR